MISRIELFKMDLPHRAISVYLYLCSRCNKAGTCWPAIPTIAKELHFSESTVRRALADLRSAGLIKSEQRWRDNGGKTSLLFCVNTTAH